MGKGCVGGEKNAVAGSDGNFREKIFEVTVFFIISYFFVFLLQLCTITKEIDSGLMFCIYSYLQVLSWFMIYHVSES